MSRVVGGPAAPAARRTTGGAEPRAAGPGPHPAADGRRTESTMVGPDAQPTAEAPVGARRARRRPAPILALLAVGVLGLAGCGGGDDEDENPTDGGATLTAADARAADQSIKDGVREIMASVESCFTGSRDYGRCRLRTQIGATALTVVPASPGVSQATVSRATATGYRILGVSLTGNRFAITKQGTQVIRSCAARTELGKAGGGCRGNGW